MAKKRKSSRRHKPWLVSYVKESVGVTIAAGLCVLSGTAAAILGFLGWEHPVPPQIIWIVCLFALLGFQAWLYRKLYLRHSALLDAARLHARLPAAQRERVHRIKETAGRISAGLMAMGEFDRESLDGWLKQLYSDAGAIREHEPVIVTVAGYVQIIKLHLAAFDQAQEGGQRVYVEELRENETRLYSNVIAACNWLLEEYPPPEAADLSRE